MPRNRSPQAGLFVIRSNGVQQVGLTIEEVARLLESDEGAITELACIQRVDDNGRMELLGVSPESLLRRDGFILRYPDIQSARQEFDSIAEAASQMHPPCELEMELAHEGTGGAAVILEFPAVCQVGVRAWLRKQRPALSINLEAGVQALSRIREAGGQIVKQTRLPGVGDDYSSVHVIG